MWDEIRRKFFHLAALLYVIGLIYFPRGLYLKLLIGWLILEGGFELLRMRWTPLNAWLLSHFGGLLRTEEKNHFTGIFWMILGTLSTVTLISSIPLTITILLYLILGDTAASLVGKRIGGWRWPNSKKKSSGKRGEHYENGVLPKTNNPNNY